MDVTVGGGKERESTSRGVLFGTHPRKREGAIRSAGERVVWEGGNLPPRAGGEER